MKALILAAGYATRLYPLTKETPKPLLEVAGKSILERLLEKIGVIPEVDHVYIVTNSRFSQVFESWVENYTYDRPVTVIDDGTTSNENRLGAIGDIQYAIEKERIEDDLMILAGDNLFDFELCDFARFFEGTNADVITAYRVKDVSMRRRLGIAELDSSGRVLSFQEKPEEPRSQWQYRHYTSTNKKHYL
jgi:glucose-1-phosphate thymidylyltransferase